jgi:hypothetical protein
MAAETVDEEAEGEEGMVEEAAYTVEEEGVEEADLEAEETVKVVVLEAREATPVESVVRLAPKEAQAFLV